MADLKKPEGYKLILVFLEKKGYKKDALDKPLLASLRYEAFARRPGQTLQDFFATENMAYADALKAGVGIDPDRRACHMFIKSGLTDDQINHTYLSLVNSSNTLDRYTIIIDYQNFPLSVVNGFQKRDEQTLGSLQPRNQVADKRAEPDEERAADSSIVSRRSVPPDDLLCLWMIRMKRSLNKGRSASTSGTSVETISVQSSPPECPVMAPRGEAATTSVRVSNAVAVPSAQTVRYRRHVNVTPAVASTEDLSCCLVPTLSPCTPRV